MNPFTSYGSIPSATQFRLPTAFGISPAQTMQNLSGTLQDCADGPGGLTRRHRFFCTVVQMKTTLCVAEGLVAEFDLKERVLFLAEHIMAVLLSLDQASMQSLRLQTIFTKVVERECRYRALTDSHRMTETDPYTREPSVWIHQNSSSQPRSSIAINSRLHS